MTLWPLRDWTDWFSKFTALAIAEFLLMSIILLVGVVMQAVAGYYHFEVLQYINGIIFNWASPLPDGHSAGFVCPHTVVSNKFVGHAYHNSDSLFLSPFCTATELKTACCCMEK